MLLREPNWFQFHKGSINTAKDMTDEQYYDFVSIP